MITTRQFNYKGYNIAIRGFIASNGGNITEPPYVAVGVYDKTRSYYITRVYLHNTSAHFFANLVEDAVKNAVHFVDSEMKYNREIPVGIDKAVSSLFEETAELYTKKQ